MRKFFLLLTSHFLAVFVGFVVGIYLLPILIAPTTPTISEIQAMISQTRYAGEFRRNLEDSDLLHWGEGTVFVGKNVIILEGSIAPGPDYKLYLSPEFLETEADFVRLKSNMIQVGDVKTFKNFIVPVPDTIDPNLFNTVIIWCEAFSQFITAAKYQ